MNPAFKQGDYLSVSRVPWWSLLTPYQNYLVEELEDGVALFRNIHGGDLLAEEIIDMYLHGYEYKVLLTAPALEQNEKEIAE